MTILETKEKILTDDNFVLSEVQKIQYLLGIKRVTRYNLERPETDLSESVAEHVAGLLVLATYFAKLEPSVADMNFLEIHHHILFHDTDELETGDVPTNLKTNKDREEARKKLPLVLAKSPELLRPRMSELNTIYENQLSPEAKFVKALDKLEGIVHCFSDRQRPVFEHLKFTKADQVRTKEVYIKPFPILFRFYEVISNEYEKRGFFFPSA